MNVRQGAVLAVSFLGAAAGIALLVQVVAPHWTLAREAIHDLSLAWILLAAALLALHYLLAFRIWRGCLRASGVVLSDARMTDTYVPALFARYVPGKVWSNAVRVALARRAGASLPEVTGAVGWEALLVLATGALLALATLWPIGIDPRIRWAAAGLAAVCIATFVGARWAIGLRRGPSLLRRLGSAAAPAKANALLRLGAVNVLAWLVYGLAHWSLARAIAPVTLSHLPLIVGAVALAWIGGYLALITPAGLGVRDGLLGLFLAPMLGAGPVVVLVAVARLLALLLELLILLVWTVSRRRATRGMSPADLPG